MWVDRVRLEANDHIREATLHPLLMSTVSWSTRVVNSGQSTGIALQYLTSLLNGYD